MQVALLRVPQEGEFYRSGRTGPLKTDVRVAAATNRNLRVVATGYAHARLLVAAMISSDEATCASHSSSHRRS